MALKEKVNSSIYVVSGLPRSGTSMMMQLLNRGGLKILTDDLRVEDENNLKGYMEFEKVKRLNSDNSWIYQAEGKAIKVIAPLIQYLPNTFHYKIIFMQRDMHEMLVSQQKMLSKDATSIPKTLAETFRKQLQQIQTWISDRRNMDVLYVNYSDVIASPHKQIGIINSFLELNLNTAYMIEAVDKNLYRNKNNLRL